MFVPCFLLDLEDHQLQQHPAEDTLNKTRDRSYQLQAVILHGDMVKIRVRTGDPGGPGGPRGPSKPLGPYEEQTSSSKLRIVLWS